jgi:hypothetical protein
MKSPSLRWRDRTESVLRDNRLIIATELLIAVILQTLHAVHIISTAIIFLFVIGWLSLWLRRSGWQHLGLNRPASWLRTIGIGAIVGLVYQVVSLFLIVPLLHQLTNEPLDLSQFALLRANVSLLIIYLTVSW